MRPGEMTYRVGDATDPQGTGPKIIAHVCNDLGRWGKGFVVSLADRYPVTREQFAAWHRGEDAAAGPFELGAVQFVKVRRQRWVANMIGQHGITKTKGVPPVRYEALKSALEKVAAFAKRHGASVHMPRIVCGLAGGTWDRIQPLIEETLLAAGLDVDVYDLPPKVSKRLTERPIENWDDYAEHM
jgi:O-acetyl-ADP-ribose deacetylase (regulator of RNase III)